MLQVIVERMKHLEEGILKTINPKLRQINVSQHELLDALKTYQEKPALICTMLILLKQQSQEQQIF